MTTRLAVWTIPAAFLLAAPLSAQNSIGIQLMNDLAWHGVSDRVQVHQPSVAGKPPYIDVWERIAIGNSYGNWAYVKNLIDCQQWTQMPFSTIDHNGYFVLWAQAPDTVKAAWTAHGQSNERVIAGVCALYGLTKPVNNYIEHIPAKPNLVVRPSTNSAPLQANVDKGVETVSDVTLLEQWWVFQDACRGRPDDELTCGKRDNLTAELTARGYMQHNRDVWTSKSDMEHFDGIVHSTNEWAVGKSAHMRALGGITTLQSLRGRLSDDKIIALWNDSQDFIRDAYPLAWEILEVQMRRIVIDHSGSGDPRYLLD